MSPLLILAAGLTTVLVLILALRINAFVALYVAATLVSLMAPGPLDEKISRVAQAFGGATGKIGIVIALAAIIATCMMESGAADKIVQGFAKAFGEKRTPFVLLGSGFTLSIPVFFDTVFYLLVPLARSSFRRRGREYVKGLLAIAAGGVCAHTLIPPTPGPLAVANTFGVDLGLMMGVGGVVGIFTASAGMIYAGWADKRFNIPFRETEADEKHPEEGASGAGGEVPTLRPPSLFMALLPVVLPVVLIAAYTISGEVARASKGGPNEALWQDLKAWFGVFGNPNLALLFSAAVALWLVRQSRGISLRHMGPLMERSLKSAGVIILITAAGAAFGEMLKLANLSQAMQESLGAKSASGYPLLAIGFGTAALLRMAQGSSTAAMIVAAAIVSAMAGTAIETLPYHPVYLALAIGSGSIPFSWMNDSGFWIFSRMSGLTEREALKTWTPLLTIMGVVGFAVTFGLALIVPLR